MKVVDNRKRKGRWVTLDRVGNGLVESQQGIYYLNIRDLPKHILLPINYTRECPEYVEQNQVSCLFRKIYANTITFSD